MPLARADAALRNVPARHASELAAESGVTVPVAQRILGDHAAALPDWPPLREPDLRRTLWNLYGPPGLRPNVWKREDGTSAPPEDRPRLFVVALAGYATEGKRTMATNALRGTMHGS